MLMTQNPQLTWALFQGLVIMKVLSPQMIQHVLQNAVQSQMPMGMQQNYPNYPPQQMYPPMMSQPPPMMSQPPQMIPPSMMAPAPMMNPMAQQYDYSSIPENQRAAVMQLMQFTDAQIAALPLAQQQQIMGLKAHLTRK